MIRLKRLTMVYNRLCNSLIRNFTHNLKTKLCIMAVKSMQTFPKRLLTYLSATGCQLSLPRNIFLMV
jgi:hypothetical protein